MAIYSLIRPSLDSTGATNILFATISQIVIPNQYIGRINSVMRSMSTIAMPIGSLIGGYTANVFSSQLIFALASIGILFISLVWLLHPKLRTLPKADEITADTFGVQFKEERERCCFIASKHNPVLNWGRG